MDWEDALELIDEIAEILEEMPERAESFTASVEGKIEGMRDWIEENERVTDKMVDALENMKTGCEKWID